MSDKVKSYFHFRKKCFSVSREGHPIEHFSWLLLRSVRFHVNLSGRERVLREQVKNVHAYVIGELVDGEKFSPDSERGEPLLLKQITSLYQVRYNPYISPNFFRADNQEPIVQAQDVLLYNKSVFVIKV